MSTIYSFGDNLVSAPGGSLAGSDSVTPDPYNPLGLPYYTVRAQFTDGYTPATPSSGSAVQVSSSPNIWDLTYSRAYWSQLFKNNTYLRAVLGANTHGQFGNVDDMKNMFEGCTNLTSVALFDTSSVGTMRYMFYNCTKIVSLPDFDTTRCINFSGMFYGCSSLLSCPNISTTFRTQSFAPTVNNMFSGCTAMASVPLLDLNRVTDTSDMFNGCRSLTSVPLFDLSTVTNASGMFSGCMSLATVPLFNTASVASASWMFYHCTSLTTIPLLNTSSLVNAQHMFEDCTALTEIPAFNLAYVAYSSRMFHNCSSVTSGTLAAYQQLAADPEAAHDTLTFYGAGPASDLAQIPVSWGGTYTGDNYDTDFE